MRWDTTCFSENKKKVISSHIYLVCYLFKAITNVTNEIIVDHYYILVVLRLLRTDHVVITVRKNNKTAKFTGYHTTKAYGNDVISTSKYYVNTRQYDHEA